MRLNGTSWSRGDYASEIVVFLIVWFCLEFLSRSPLPNCATAWSLRSMVTGLPIASATTPTSAAVQASKNALKSAARSHIRSLTQGAYLVSHRSAQQAMDDKREVPQTLKRS